MKERHRQKAIIGVSGWFTVLVGFLAIGLFTKPPTENEPGLSEQTMITLFWGSIVVQSILFFWGGHHLVKAKGYSNALLLPGLLGPCLQLIMLVVLLVLPDKFYPRSMRRSRVRSEHSSEFQMERIVRCRRNALAGNALGLAGILMGTILIAFNRAPFEDRNNEFVLGMVIFIVGYFCVITGCWWWAKAKAWPQAVVLIGLLPFAIGSIPGMHRVLVSTPGLLPATMIVTPLIQIVTLLVLPDRSRMPRQN